MIKIFGIGLSKTGTTTLAAALEILGFTPALHSPCSYVEIARCGSATDLTIAYRFRTLAKIWPDAKFVFTHRPIEDWIKSYEGQIRRRSPRWHRPDYDTEETAHLWAVHEAVLAVYGQAPYEREAWRAAYYRHQHDVEVFFADDPGRLLSIDLTRNTSGFVKWQALCRFLEVPMPHVEFPHENKAQP